MKGFPVLRRNTEAVICAVPLCAVTDAKDVFDKSNSDTPTYGAQRSMAFSVCWMRCTLAMPNTSLKWTATENMFVDCGTKEMDVQHLHRILESGKWSIGYSPEFVRQTTKKKSSTITTEMNPSLLGEPLDSSSPVFPYLTMLSSSPGWHFREGMVLHVARNAKSFRTPDASF